MTGWLPRRSMAAVFPAGSCRRQKQLGDNMNCRKVILCVKLILQNNNCSYTLHTDYWGWPRKTTATIPKDRPFGSHSGKVEVYTRIWLKVFWTPQTTIGRSNDERTMQCLRGGARGESDRWALNMKTDAAMGSLIEIWFCSNNSMLVAPNKIHILTAVRWPTEARIVASSSQ